MTVLVGVLATDGAVIAADRAVTFGPDPRLHTISDRMQKVFCIGNDMVVAGTGQVGMAQRFATIATEFVGHLGTIKKPVPGTPPRNPTPQQRQTMVEDLKIKGLEAQVQALQNQLQHRPHAEQVAAQVVHQGRVHDGDYLGTALSQLMTQDLGRTQAKQGQFGALAAYVANDKPYLCEFAVGDFQPEQKNDGLWYAAMGSGQILADPYLAFMRRTFWKNGRPTIEDAIFTAVWVIYHAIEAAPGLIAHPIDIAVLKKWDGNKYSAKLLTEAERDEHLDTVRASDEHLVAFRQKPKEVPVVPEPPELPKD